MIPELGTMLRWTAAMPAMAAIAGRDPAVSAFLDRTMSAIRRILVEHPLLKPIAGAPAGVTTGWSDHASIVTFAVYDRADRRRLLNVVELAPLHRALARSGVLLGQPVGLGQFGGLRIALGARNLLEPDADRGLQKLSEALHDLVAQPDR